MTQPIQAAPCALLEPISVHALAPGASRRYVGDLAGLRDVVVSVRIADGSRIKAKIAIVATMERREFAVEMPSDSGSYFRVGATTANAVIRINGDLVRAEFEVENVGDEHAAFALEVHD